jgi:hypothetical protein
MVGNLEVIHLDEKSRGLTLLARRPVNDRD